MVNVKKKKKNVHSFMRILFSPHSKITIRRSEPNQMRDKTKGKQGG